MADEAQGGAAPAPAPAPKTWYDGADSDTVGWLQLKGWDKLDASRAAMEATKSRREAERFIGAPPDQLVRVPKDASDQEGWARVHAKLGVPDSSDKYDFASVKFANGEGLDPDFSKEVRTLAHDLKLNPSQAVQLASHLARMGDVEESTDQERINTRVQASQEQLRKDWGSQYGSNKIIAQNAIQAYLGQKGITGEVAQQKLNSILEIADKSVGLDVFMDMMRWAGVATGQDVFIKGGANNEQLTPQSAQAKLSTLTNDPAWRERFMRQDPRAVEDFNNLTLLINSMKSQENNRRAY